LLGRHYNTGVTAGLIDQKHAKKMGGSALFLFLWAVRRQTSTTKDGWGVVLYGRDVTYQAIKRETNFPLRTLQRWMDLLISEGYLRTQLGQHGMKIFIAKQKKFKPGKRQISTGIPQARSPHVANLGTPRVANLNAKCGEPEILQLSATHTNNKDLHSSSEAPRCSKELDLNFFKKESAPAAETAASLNHPSKEEKTNVKISSMAELHKAVAAVAGAKAMH
jgi:hypothetical protein